MTDMSGSSNCPECGRPATGNFCQHCGANLGGRFCNQCGSALAPGAKFCSECGAKAAGGRSPVGGGASTSSRAAGSGGAGGRGGRSASGARGAGARAAREPVGPTAPSAGGRAAALVGPQNLPWWIAGIAMFALIVFVGVSMVRPAGPAAPAAGAGGGAVPTAGVAPDISNMTPIEAATRLFNRVMTAVSQGDSSQAQAFVPMAIGAYERARPLDNDGLFHLSMLNRTAMNLEAALDNAEEILENDPNHLLGLAAAAEASIELGEMDRAAEYYRRIAAVYDSEIARGLAEYDDHSRIVEVLDEDAARFLAGRS